jgi:hypothetical protein
MALIVGKRPFYTNGQHFDYLIALTRLKPMPDGTV